MVVNWVWGGKVAGDASGADGGGESQEDLKSTFFAAARTSPALHRGSIRSPFVSRVRRQIDDRLGGDQAQAQDGMTRRKREYVGMVQAVGSVKMAPAQLLA